MTNAQRDNNQIPTLLATDKDDGITPVAVKAEPTSHQMACSNGTLGSDIGNENASHDENSVPSMVAVSSDDGETPVPIYADSATGAILVKTT